MKKQQIFPGLHGLNVNVSPSERMLSVFAGSAMAMVALKRRNWASVALVTGGGLLVWRGLSGHCVTYQAAGVNTAEPGHKGQHTEQVVTVNAPVEKLYEFWRNFENLPGIMYYLDSVRMVDEKRSHWKAKAPAGQTVEWDAEIISDVPNQRIEWRSSGDATVPNSGRVEFTPHPAGRGTEVRVNVDYQIPAGKLGVGVAKLFGKTPGTEIREDLRRFKQMMETGEIPTTKGQPAGYSHSMLDAFGMASKGA